MTRILAALLLAACTTSASAAPYVRCMPREVLARSLTSKHHEQQRDWRLAEDGTLFEFWVSAKREHDGRTWSLLSVTPSGRACLMMYGNGARLPATPAKGRRL